jgi:glycosyltransferase involved in cell wall biosynthesis
MKVALVHDYIREYGGAERVLKILTELYPEAPIYTAFRVKGSTADKEFKGKRIIECFLAPILKIDNLYSPLRFLIPLIWRSFDLSDYDLVITSAGWYVTRGFKVGPKTKVICYCHTPPRWLYGFETSVKFSKYWPVKVYGAIVGHFIRMYDFATAQKVDYFIANSKNVAARIEKYYRRDSKLIYPPVEVEKIIKATTNLKKDDYFLIVSRLVGAKGLEEAAELAKKLNFKLKIVGETYGFTEVKKQLERLSGGHIELLGRVSDERLYELYGKAKGFIALARDEDFGMSVVEAQAAGTPVIAFKGGGFKESIIDGQTGVFIEEIDEKAMSEAIKKINSTKWEKTKLQSNARRFSKEKFKTQIRAFIENKWQAI